MNSLKKGAGAPLWNFEGGPGILLLNFEGGPRVPLLNFRESRVPLLNFEGGPGPGVLVPILHHAQGFRYLVFEVNFSSHQRNIVCKYKLRGKPIMD